MRPVINHVSEASQYKLALVCWRNWSWEKNAILHPSVNIIKNLLSCHWHIVPKAVEKFPAHQWFKEMFTMGWNSHQKPLGFPWGRSPRQRGTRTPNSLKTILLIITTPGFDFYSTSHICLPSPAICLSLSFKHYFPFRYKQFIAGELLYTKWGL